MMAGQRRRRIRRGNLVAQRLGQRLKELGWGSTARLLVRLHLMSGRPGFSELGELDRSTLSKIRAGSRPLFDYELWAIAEALGVSAAWLSGLTDDPIPPPGITRILDN